MLFSCKLQREPSTPCVCSFGQLSVPNIWRAIHKHFTVASEEITFDVINDDLIGFLVRFHSIDSWMQFIL